MNHYVPEFELDEDYLIPTSSALTRSKKSPMAEEDIMELLWQNGQVVMQSQNQRSVLKRSSTGDAVMAAEQSAAKEIIRPEEPPAQLFMQEDEMASWLHYPIDDSSLDRDLYAPEADLFYPAPGRPAPPPVRIAPVPELRPSDVRIPNPSAATTVTSGPPMPPRSPEAEPSGRLHNFVHFSRPKGRTEPGPSSSKRTTRESTVVDSSVTPAPPAPESRVSHFTGSMAQVSSANIGCSTMSGAAAAATSSAGGGGRETGTCDLTVTSSPGGSGASVSASAEPVHKPLVTEDRKRKGKEADDFECQSEDIEFDSPDAKKQARGSTSTKRSRAAEVHNLSERRRRDRINEKMRALQELIPRCNKSDKASMLDEAIEYLKSLQLQVQMMSMGCSMVPMMYPGVQQYMPPMGMSMGMGMGMAMGMEMGMSRPMIPFPSMLAGSGLPTPAAAAHLGPRFPVPGFHMPPVPMPDPSRMQSNIQSDPMLNSLGNQNPSQPLVPSYADPYQQYLSLHQTQVPLSQNQATMQPGTSKPSSGTRELNNHNNLQSG